MCLCRGFISTKSKIIMLIAEHYSMHFTIFKGLIVKMCQKFYQRVLTRRKKTKYLPAICYLCFHEMHVVKSTFLPEIHIRAWALK